MLYVLACIYVILSCSGLILFKLGSSAGLSIGFSQGFLNMKLSGLSLLGIGSALILIGVVMLSLKR